MNIDMTRLVTADQKAAQALAAAQGAARARLVAAIEGFSEKVTGDVPLSEKLSWGTKEMAARAVLAGAGSAEDKALLQGEAKVTGEAVSDLAARIVRNSDTYRGLVAMLTGLRRGAEAAIAAARTPSEADAVADAALVRLNAADLT
jgi:hypothetical protein